MIQPNFGDSALSLLMNNFESLLYFMTKYYVRICTVFMKVFSFMPIWVQVSVGGTVGSHGMLALYFDTVISMFDVLKFETCFDF